VKFFLLVAAVFLYRNSTFATVSHLRFRVRGHTKETSCFMNKCHIESEFFKTFEGLLLFFILIRHTKHVLGDLGKSILVLVQCFRKVGVHL
jgi:hypothetical protein